MAYSNSFNFVPKVCFFCVAMLFSVFLLMGMEEIHFCNGEVTAKCVETEKESLLAFRNSITDPSGGLSSWVGDDCCQWAGIGCSNETGSVISLDLNSFQLEGEVPATLGLLNNLQKLDLAYNSFWGSIPGTIGNLTSLQILYVQSNKMNGTIPESLGQLSKLVELNLMANQWEGVITEAHLMNLSKLETLMLSTSENKLLEFNITHGWVPPFRLNYIQVEFCKVGPLFPKWLQVQSELTQVYLRNVGIEDTISQEWFSKLSSKLIVLDLKNNRIKGKVPRNLESPGLEVIDLSSNAFEGPLPFWSTNATQVYFQGNSFSGAIPQNIGELMPRVRSLHLSDNRLNGTLPSSICKLNDLQALSIRNNKISGELFDCWPELQSLWVLDVSNNSLTGTIPGSISFIRSLGMLLLSQNNLHGEIPNALQNCSYLTSIDLGENRLSGKIPSWIGEMMSSIFLLRLRSNLFDGEIPRQLCKLQNLHFLDLSNNNLSGEIPKCINNLTALIYGNISQKYYQDFQFRMTYFEEEIMVVTKGQEHQFGSNIALLSVIDISQNNLTGAIPDEVTNLRALRSLNISWNHFSGSMPEKIGDLATLETLDLSHNHLSGPISPSLSSLTFISHLDLSYNNFSGRIPTGNQLQTLDSPSIYEGNPFLCGFPLQTKCHGEEISTAPPSPHDGDASDEDEEKNGSENLGLYVSIGLGFAIGFLGISGALLRKEFRRPSGSSESDRSFLGISGALLLKEFRKLSGSSDAAREW